ncbi:NADPH:quinone oxidoreductase family protein [Aromatoleum petrolei]|uniref:Zinc-binding dehydrogenase n=1 Tax=Aromatoleum petrolei TaxID=76116 RepID=A0ABX1MKU9_9RHOO|nr:NADPH:quinone oxidoreductase family protein [Aromatoleum petrolei]NMF88594.1 zinc-binding dehydrogenase [Aromatoleum petrolei]QTQ34699.1 Putative NADPH quinone oxidoreductase [Aromatoleum petrolei]
MRAIVCKHYGPPQSLVLEELPEPVPGPGQLVVEVRAAGVNFPDALVVQGKHQYRPVPPFGVGCELAGTIKALGPRVGGFSIGQRVYAQGSHGAFAEVALVDADAVRPMPDDLSFEAAAGLSITYNTAYYSLVILGRVSPGETVLVLGGAGGVGLAAIEVAKACGARVVAAASNPEKLAVCAAAGADMLINYSAENLRERLRHFAPQGVNVVLDPVGGAYAEPSLRAMAWQGRYLVVGFAAGEIPKIPLNLVLLKGCSVTGVFLGEALSREPETARAIETGVGELMAAGKIRPYVSARYPLERTADALNDLLMRRVIGKIVITP